MAGWPKIIYVRGVGIPVEAWEEVDELIQRYGAEVFLVKPEDERIGPGNQKPHDSTWRSALSPTDRTLLHSFVDAGPRGVTTRQIGPALGRSGKSIRPALEAWSRRIGLVAGEGASAFEPIQRADGRGFRMTDLHLQAARTLLGP